MPKQISEHNGQSESYGIQKQRLNEENECPFPELDKRNSGVYQKRTIPNREDLQRWQGGDSNIKTNYTVGKKSEIQTWTYFSLHEKVEKEARSTIPGEEFDLSVINMSFIQLWQLLFGLGIMLVYYYSAT